ncbi:MAG: HDIG domain-containing protein [Dehalococcoidia bacterium]|nr:HDIG domain-containing protein [Dehalococcoidia bacterium]
MIRQRVRQFLGAGARPGAAERALAEVHLPAELQALFFAQHPRDVVHAAATARWLLARGHADAELIQAALLHDVGKGHQRRLDRVAYVLAERAGMATALASPGSHFALRRALARSAAHGAAGAERLREAGAAARVVELTLRHHSPSHSDAVLALLQQADAAS